MVKFRICFILFFLFMVGGCEYSDNILDIQEVITSDKEIYYDSVVGRIQIEGTSINELIFQSNDNLYYLSHNRDKKEDIVGEVFLDYRVSLEDKIILIYGHNSTFIKTPFKELEKYEKKDFFDDNAYINIYSNDEKITYEIFSVYVEDEDFTYMNINYEGEDYLKHINYLKDKSWYNRDVELKSNDRIIILQTCSFNKNYGNDKYLLVIGKEI